MQVQQWSYMHHRTGKGVYTVGDEGEPRSRARAPKSKWTKKLDQTIIVAMEIIVIDL